MFRITTTALLALAISVPFAARAEVAIDQKAPEATVVAAASEDAVVLPPASKPAQEEKSEVRVERERGKRLVPHGSSESAAGYRFTNPYAVPQQTLPLTFPAITTFSF